MHNSYELLPNYRAGVSQKQCEWVAKKELERHTGSEKGKEGRGEGGKEGRREGGTVDESTVALSRRPSSCIREHPRPQPLLPHTFAGKR